jgi:beta-glucosidase
VKDVESKRPMPSHSLRGFERIHLKRGESKRVTFRLKPADDFAYYDEARRAYAVEPGEFEIQVGASSRDIRLKTRVRVD